MRTIISFTAIFIILFSSCNSTATKQNDDTANTYTAPDDAAIKKAVDDAYSAISFKDGKPNFDSIQYAFIPRAQLINYITDTAQILSISDFVKAFKNYVETTKIQTFQEQEMYGRTDQFGNIAQRISSYKTYINSLDVVKERGVNSFQLIKTPQGWKVSSIIWDVEKSGLSIPNVYLGK